MVRSFSEVVTWAKKNPHPHQGGTWNMRCEQFINNAGGFNYGFSTAKLDYQAAKAAGHLLTPAQLDIASVPTGWLLFWDYGTFGHVAFKAPGNRALMASSFLDDRFGTSALGYVSAPGYQKMTGHRYLGASPFHGPETLTGVNMLTSADKDWIKTAIANAIASALKADHDDTAAAVWTYSQTSPLTKKAVSMRSQLLNARAEVSHIQDAVDDIQKRSHTPGE